MRCLRAIGEVQETAKIFLSKDNMEILEEELQENFRLSVDDLKSAGDEKENVEVKLVPPPVKIKLKRISKLHKLIDKELTSGLSLELDKADREQYRIIRRERSLTNIAERTNYQEDITHIKEQREFSELTLVAEIARYLNMSPIRIHSILENTAEGTIKIVDAVNEFNELLYDWIIPRLFGELYDLKEFKSEDEIEIELVKAPNNPDFYKVKADKSLTANCDAPQYSSYKQKSFHLDHYCFDSKPENAMFWTLLKDQRVDKVWFTGMLTHGQSDFMINYIDPTTHSVRSYYPDFLIKMNDGSYVILEVKGDNMVDDAVVKAKADYATQIASASSMTYKLVKGSDAMKGVGV